MSLGIPDNTDIVPEKKQYPKEVKDLAKAYGLKKAFVMKNLEKISKVSDYIEKEQGNRFSLMGQLRNLIQDTGVVFIPAKGFWFSQGDAKNNFRMQIGLDIHETVKHIDNPKDEYALKRLLFSGFHECSHYLDMIRNPTKKEREAIIKAYSGYFSTKHTVTEDFSFLTGYFLHRLHNCVDDTIVNDMVCAKTIFGTDSGHKDFPRDLYAKQLFASYVPSDKGDYIVNDGEEGFVPTKKGEGTHMLQDGIGESIDYTSYRLPDQFSYSLLRSHMIPDQKIIQSEEVAKIFTQTTQTSIRELIDKISISIGEAKEFFTKEEYYFLLSLFDFMKETRKALISRELSEFAHKTPEEILAAFGKTRFKNGKRITSIPKSERITIMRNFMDPIYIGLILQEFIKSKKIVPPKAPPEAYGEGEGGGGGDGTGDMEESGEKSDDDSDSDKKEDASGLGKEKDGTDGTKKDNTNTDNKNNQDTGDGSHQGDTSNSDNTGKSQDEIIKNILKSLENESTQEDKRNLSSTKSQAIQNKIKKNTEDIMKDRTDTIQKLLGKSGKNLTDREVRNLLEKYDDIFVKAKPYIDDLAKIWEERITASMAEIAEKILIHVQRSEELDIDKAIDRIVDINSGTNPEELWLHLREIIETRFTLRPNILRVRLILDNSGSMREYGKIEQCALFTVILSKSLEQLTTIINEKLGLTGEKSFFADTEIWKFGEHGNSEKIKSFSSSLIEKDGHIEHTEIDKNTFVTDLITSVSSLDASDMNTCDAEVWEKIQEDLTSEKDIVQKGLSSGNIMECIFEITDGATSTPEVQKYWRNIQENFKEVQLGTILVGADEVPETWGHIGHLVPDPRELLSVLQEKILGELQNTEWFTLEKID